MNEEDSNSEAAVNMNYWNAQVVTEFRSNNAFLGGPFGSVLYLLLAQIPWRHGDVRHI